MKIWKYRLHVGRQTIMMPSAARVVHAGSQSENSFGDTLTIWAEVDPNADPMPRDFAVIGTGSWIPLGYRHVGTVLEPPYVWHVYQNAETERGQW